MASLTTTQSLAAETARSTFWRTALLLVGMNTVNAFIAAFSIEKLSFLYKDRLLLSATAFATLGVLTGLPSYVRPLLGSLSDFVPLRGYHRRSYFALSALVTGAAFAALAAMPFYSYVPVLALVILTGFGANLTIVVAEAVSVRVGNQTGQVQRLQALQMSTPALWSMVFTGHLSGYVTQHWSYHACFLAAALCALACLPLTFLIDERRLPPASGHSPEEMQPEEMQPEEMQAKQADKAATRNALRAGLRSRELWIVLAFLFYLQFTPGTGTSQFFYSVDALHFSKQLLGSLNAYGSGGTLLGYIAFALLSPRLSLRAIVWGGIIGSTLPGYIPDFFLHSASSAGIIYVVTSAAYAVFFASLMTIAARACLPRIEAIVFGAVLSVNFLGGALGDRLGTGIYTYFSAGGHLTQGWYAVNWIGMLATLSAAAFIPFLPAWARSKKTLVALTLEAAMQNEMMQHERASATKS